MRWGRHSSSSRASHALIKYNDWEQQQQLFHQRRLWVSSHAEHVRKYSISSLNMACLSCLARYRSYLSACWNILKRKMNVRSIVLTLLSFYDRNLSLDAMSIVWGDDYQLQSKSDSHLIRSGCVSRESLMRAVWRYCGTKKFVKLKFTLYCDALR